MSKPYLLISDTHFHNWTAFANVEADRVNSRLKLQLAEAERAYKMLADEGGNQVFHAGDLFHVRGKIMPSVMNPVAEFFERKVDEGFETAILSGNHDLESNEALALTSAVSSVSSAGITAVNDVTLLPPYVVMVPWHSNLDDLRETLTKLHGELKEPENTDVIIHAPVNDVLLNIPNTGLGAKELEDMGFKRVFVGHYHNHKNFNDKVWSIGALTHQTWGDVGSRAGFCLVWPDKVKWFASSAPNFMSLSIDADEGDIMEVDGNYVRADIEDPTPTKVDELRKLLLSKGAAGVTTRAIITAKSERGTTETVSAIDSLEDSITKYSTKKHNKAVAKVCREIFAEVSEVA